MERTGWPESPLISCYVHHFVDLCTYRSFDIPSTSECAQYLIVAICCRKTGTVVIISSFGSCSSPRRCGLRQLRRFVLRFKMDPSLFLVSPRQTLQQFGARTRPRVVPRLLKFASRPVRIQMLKSGYRSVTQLQCRPTTRGAPNLCDPTKKAELHLNLSSSWRGSV
jgi:hypothetical protein